MNHDITENSALVPLCESSHNGTNAEFSVMESFKFSPPFFRQFHRKCLP